MKLRSDTIDRKTTTHTTHRLGSRVLGFSSLLCTVGISLLSFVGLVHGANQNIASTTPEPIPICYHFGCKTRDLVTIEATEWDEVRNWFAHPARDAEAERDQIKRAVGWLEVVVGRYTPIHRDLGQDALSNGGLGQMDCIDEEKNVSTFLRLFESKGLLQFHRVVDPAYRRTAWDQHWAGQIEEIANGERWVVDSWFQAYGHNPYIQKTEQWTNIPFFFSSSYIDNSPD